ncbi:hypothetical protein JOB18_045200 [Solea senegalensis]|uniref:Uncharacterized protein n=1 Tax=Solea senegalensis TaxID=28829 RepID=A0AAV6QIF3_SOLSE|nr:hypothetical protein JOB18_045200 [Solea senegalensis]
MNLTHTALVHKEKCLSLTLSPGQPAECGADEFEVAHSTSGPRRPEHSTCNSYLISLRCQHGCGR